MKYLLAVFIFTISTVSFAAKKPSAADQTFFENCLAEDSANPTRLNLEVCNCLTQKVRTAPKDIQAKVRAYEGHGLQSEATQSWGQKTLAQCVQTAMTHKK